MSITLFNNLKEQEKDHAIKELIEDSSPRQDFFLMIGFSILMATLGILLDSIAVIIGSMLIAPLLYPLLSLSLGIVIADHGLMRRSIITIAKSFFLSVAIAMIVAFFLSGQGKDIGDLNSILGSEFLLAHVFVAVSAGFAAAFAFIKPQLNERLPGVAIAVALIPPLASTGIGLAHGDLFLIRDSLLLFVINIAGIVFAGIMVFSLMQFYRKRSITKKAVKQDEKEIREEKTKAQGSDN